MAGKILVVDDDDAVRNMLDIFLKDNEYSVDTANGVDAALKLMESNDYAIMIIDKNMPGIDGGVEGGIDLLRYVRSQSLSSEVIMMTGFPSVETAMEAIELGAFDYIHKPFSLEDLGLKIRRLWKYRSFVNPDNTIGIYRCLQWKMCELIKSVSKLSDTDIEPSMLSINNEIDKLFVVLKEGEKIMLAERESLSRIAILAEQLKMNFHEADVNYDLAEEIVHLSKQRL